ncbi:helix-turn-helix domain-containing protein [Janibacter alittae]|uniref:Helix-turn-helix domain-containing protein n=1 Tax=Janibacter alittae TaxID=3115209 RepID=A0ABZ2MII1_9MICO
MDETTTVTFPQFMTVQEVAKLLQVPVSTVYHWAAYGEGPPSFKVGKHRRFKASAVAEWIETAEARGVA